MGVGATVKQSWENSMCLLFLFSLWSVSKRDRINSKEARPLRLGFIKARSGIMGGWFQEGGLQRMPCRSRLELEQRKRALRHQISVRMEFLDLVLFFCVEIKATVVVPVLDNLALYL